jgi:16S rRNA (guanine966-N2)-methyltransferase
MDAPRSKLSRTPQNRNFRQPADQSQSRSGNSRQPRGFYKQNQTQNERREQYPAQTSGKQNFSTHGKKTYGKPHAKTRRPRPENPFLPLKPEIKIINDMQITDGRHRGAQLISTLSPKVRPSARRIREALFRILGKRVRFARFLDLCAGSGAVGIEAISRGALLCTFVERSAKMCAFIRKNLEACKVCPDGHGEIHQIEIAPFLKRMANRKRRWDIVFFDPPYDFDYDEILQFFARGKCLNPSGGIFIIEHHAEMFFPPAVGVLVRRRVIIEGESALTFYERVK